MECYICNSTMICVEDFAGNSRQDGFWAFWCPECRVVLFGGAWWYVPNMPSDNCPEEYEVYKYVRDIRARYATFCFVCGAKAQAGEEFIFLFPAQAYCPDCTTTCRICGELDAKEVVKNGLCLYCQEKCSQLPSS